MIKCEGADEIGPPGECNKANAVIRALADELFGNEFHGIDTVGPTVADSEILRQHRARHIQNEHDIHPRGLHPCGDASELRTGQSHDEERQRQIGQRGQKCPRTAAPTITDFRQHRGIGEGDSCRASEFAFEPGKKRDDEKQKKNPGMGKCEA